MKQKSCHKFIYKLHSKQLRDAKWNLKLPLDVALRDYSDCIVSLNDSQLLRFIDELNGITDADQKAKELKSQIRKEKRKPKNSATGYRISNFYKQLYELQFQEDYLCVIMDRNSDYDRANKGFKVNGVKYKRFLGTNGGIKSSTIVYVSERLYPELKKRLDNGRNPDGKLVPAKLEAYQALICSGSTPITEPDGIIVVDDCITHFLDNIIMINDECDGEPDLQEIDNYEIEHNDSDGYGLMLPDYSKLVNFELTGAIDKTISGMNTRYAWTKGMLYTFDYIEFAEKIAGTYMVKDAWGTMRDVRKSQVILTTSMLKLWNSYDSWEDYYRNCKENHYQFSTSKTTPEELDNVRNTNYQFLQSYDFTDEELKELCQPTIEEIKDVLGFDYRKSIAFLAGYGMNGINIYDHEYVIQALMIEPQMINDPFVRHKIMNMIKTRIDMAKRGAIQIQANYTMIGGDPYALAQSMFGMEVTGLLKSGELYHKYWIDKGATELACFRAPMTCHNNIRRMKLRNNDEVAHWYQYITTAIVLNAWDTACDAMNGADKDGDTNMDTDNPIIVNKTRNEKTIMCVQRKAEKIIPHEEDIIKANKLAFNDDIGTVTNHVTSMIEVQSGFEKGSPEYEELSYRIMCGQLYQQNTIDRAKGIIAKPMPKYWYNRTANLSNEEDDDETAAKKKFNLRIVADKKPYFMIYIYPDLRKQYKDYIKNVNAKCYRISRCSIDELYAKQNRTQKEDLLIEYYERFMPVGKNPCVINRICWLFENEFDGYLSQKRKQPTFDYTILKSDVEYSQYAFKKIKSIYDDYVKRVAKYITESRKKRRSGGFETYLMDRNIFTEEFRRECEIACSNEKELCNIVLDLCYTKESSKQFAWDICGETIIQNLLEKNNNIIHYPVKTDFSSNYDFVYRGVPFIMEEQKLEVDNSDCIK